jgi:hypothetical protein
MRQMTILTALLLFTCGITRAQAKDSVTVTGATSPAIVSNATAQGADSLSTARPLDTAKSVATPPKDSLSAAGVKSVATDQNQPQKLKLIKRKYNARQQVLIAAGMMIFVVGIMTMAQQWNPK